MSRVSGACSLAAIDFQRRRLLFLLVVMVSNEHYNQDSAGQSCLWEYFTFAAKLAKMDITLSSHGRGQHI